MDPISRFLFLLPLILSLQTHQFISGEATGIELIKKTCNHCVYKDLCVTSLQSASGSQEADLNGLAVIALKLATSNGSDTSKHINQLISATTDPFIEQCLNDCSENYLDAIDQLEDSLAALDSKGYNDVNTWVTAAMTDAESCEEGFKDKPGHASVLTHRNTVFSKLCSNALAIINILAAI